MPNSVERCSTNMSNSSNEPLSSRADLRSRAVSLPRACCASMRFSPPPSLAPARRSSRVSRISFIGSRPYVQGSAGSTTAFSRRETGLGCQPRDLFGVIGEKQTLLRQPKLTPIRVLLRQTTLQDRAADSISSTRTKWSGVLVRFAPSIDAPVAEILRTVHVKLSRSKLILAALKVLRLGLLLRCSPTATPGEMRAGVPFDIPN